MSRRGPVAWGFGLALGIGLGVVAFWLLGIGLLALVVLLAG